MSKYLHKWLIFKGVICKFLLISACCLVTTQFASATIKLPRLVINGMVLQRDVSLPIWGTAAVGETVNITFKGQSYQTVTPASGKWTINLAPSAAGGPYTMVVAGSNTITITDILIGDVYVCSGQSNMRIWFGDGNGPSYYAADIAASANPNIRQLEINFALSATPLEDVNPLATGWEAASPSTLKNFSVVAYYFAKDLYEKYQVPIGIITSTYSGTIIEAWISREGLVNFPGLANQSMTPMKDTNPSAIHNAMIAPIKRYEIKGFIWYQGESNSSNAFEYRSLFPAFIADVRDKFNKPNLPFIFVQLANYSAVVNPQQVSAVAEVREAQAMALSIPHTAMVVAHETSSGTDIHPMEKKPVGQRLSLATQKVVYGDDVIYQGPSLLSSVTSGNKITVTFKNVGTGLIKAGTTLNQFTIAGADKVYKTAVATITGANTVEVSAATVAAPMYVRYAWADNPKNANLYNSANLPAESFRTDEPTPGVNYVAQAFTPGNLVLTRYGNGSTLPAMNTTVPIFLDEYSTSGVNKNLNRPMPGGADSYDPNGITNLIVGTHSFGVEALLSLSENKKYLSFTANNKLVGETVNSTGSKTIAVITADGGLNTNTTANLGVARMATVSNDLSRVYYISQTQGLCYVPYQTANSNVVIAAGENGYRTAAIYNGQLYVSTSVSAATANYPEITKQISTVGTGMPTTGIQTLTPLPGLPTTEIVRQFVFLASAGNNVYDLFYGVTESGKLIKYKLESGNWESKGFIAIANVVSLTGSMSGTNAALFSTTLNSTTYASTLVKVDDELAATSTLSGSATVIATAAANTYFKGVAFAPENSDVTMLPVKLSFFTGAKDPQGVKLNWQTLSEQNSGRYEILRAADGVSFHTIGVVNAAGTSNKQINYSFTDFTPLAGVNYYQLNQVDKDGASEKSKIVSVDADLIASVFKIAQTAEANFQVTISSDRKSTSKLSVINLKGERLLEMSAILDKGLNAFPITLSGLPSGIYILQSSVDGGSRAIKFYLNNEYIN
ncbi:MAG: hypothetical protein EOP54_12765 [Sphingobacteriales bacterium]|nr:MAG: hypothetical protein EOP54_12765 [Sphingobacteriales bacterium]